jgi:cytochrome c oxidase subunit 2
VGAKRYVLFFVAAGVLAFGACGDDNGDGGGGSGNGGATQSVDLTAQDFAFDPSSIEVDSGAEVELTFNNEDDVEHSFTAEDLDAEVEAEGGESATTTFTAPESGTVEFICKYHPDQMTGEISVR